MMSACRKAQLEDHPGLKKDDSSYLTGLRLYHIWAPTIALYTK